MTALVASVRRLPNRIQFPTFDGMGRRGAVVAALVAVAMAVPGGPEGLRQALGDAYLSVSVFVAGTLLVVFGLERVLGADLGAWLARYRRWQVPAAAFLGATPGCGGAIVAVTQFTRGHLSFGSLVAALTATMGDAMFLLLAREPATGLLMFAVGLVVGVAAGYVIDAIHGDGFMKPAEAAPKETPERDAPVAPLSRADRLWLAIAAPGLVLGVMGALQVEVNAGVEEAVGIAGAALALALWVVRGGESRPCADGACATTQPGLLRRVIDDTNFVTTWVIFAFAGYELLMAITGVDLGRVLQVWQPLVPLAAVAVGLIPGCGPQIVVSSLYLAGNVPLSAQMGNAISNDGDALLPALAVAPKAALMATLYSTGPALAVAYGWYAFFE